MALEHEKQVYHEHLSELLGPDNANAGKYTVIHGDEIHGIFDSYPSAISIAYGKYGLSPFMVRKIEPEGTSHFFSRSL